MGRVSDLLVSTKWLHAHLADPGIRLVDCRYAFDRDAREDYVAAHIPGAVYLQWDVDLSDPDHEVEWMIAPPEQVQAVMQRLGIGDDTTIVAYDQEGGHFASRLWLVLARYGHGEQVRILEGGWTAWTQEGRPVTSEPTPPPPPVRPFTLDPSRYQPQLIATWQEVLEASRDGSAVVLDVRRWSEHTGEEVRAKRGGRVPGARWFFWQENLNWEGDRRFLPRERIAARAAALGITPTTPVITYCQGAVRAAHAALALQLAGFENVRVYDGSWAEWGNRDDLPLETGEPSND